MRENRRFLRVNYLGSGWLLYNDAKFNCRLENISENGALIHFKKTPDVLIPNETCILMLHQEKKDKPYQEFVARIVRFENDIAALEFTDSGVESHRLLDELIRKELYLINGSQKLIDLGRKAAKKCGIGLTVSYFDKGEIIPEREMHTLRLSAGEHAVNVHLHRDEIEAFYGGKGSVKVKAKISHAVEQLKAA